MSRGRNSKFRRRGINNVMFRFKKEIDFYTEKQKDELKKNKKY